MSRPAYLRVGRLLEGEAGLLEQKLPRQRIKRDAGHEPRSDEILQPEPETGDV